MNKQKTLIVLSPSWPDNYSGYGIALRSSLELYKNKYKKIFYVVLSFNDRSDDFISDENIKYFFIDIKKRKKIENLINGIINNIPIFVSMYYSKKISKILNSLLDGLVTTKSDFDLCVEDLALNKYIENINIKPEIYFVRSHNLMYEILDGMRNQSIVFDLLIAYEKNKIFKFEKNIIDKTDIFYAISDRDQTEYEKLYSKPINGFIDIFIEQPNYNDTKIINQNLINFGNANLWKSHGIKWFIDNIFKKLILNFPNTKFILAGKGTDAFQDDNVIGLGFIENDDDIYNEGTFFINPQLSGSGVKIKSINAILNRKLLFSTVKGTEGIPIEKNVHYFEFDNFNTFLDSYEYCIKNENEILKIIDRTSLLVKKYYSRNEFLNRNIITMEML